MRLLPLVVLTTFLAAAPARAEGYEANHIQDASSHQRPTMLSFFLGLPFGYGCHFSNCGTALGVSARFYIPILHDGFIPPVNDSFGIEFGGDVAAYTGPNGLFFLGIPAEARWDFHFLPQFQAYVKAGLGLGIVGGSGGYAGLYFTTGLGIIWFFAEKFSLRVEAGYPWLKVGIGIAF